MPKNLPVVLSREEIKSMILNTRNTKHKLLIELLYSSGLRVSEAVKIKTIDKGWNQYLANLKKVNGSKVEVGLFAKVGQEVVQRAVQNEFGTRSIPARSFMRSTFNENVKKVVGRFENILKNANKTNIDRQLNLIGLEQTNKIKEKITNIKYPVNSPSTIARKGSDNPLIDTGEMRSKINWEVRR